MKRMIPCTALASTLALSALVLPSSHAETKADASAAGTETRTVAPFSAIALNGPFHVIISGQGAQSLELSGPKKQMAEIETTVSGDTLTVSQPKKKGWTFNFGFGKSRPPMTVRISAANLKSLKMSGSGDVDLLQYQGQQLSLVAGGPGDLHANGSVRDLTVQASGSGDLDLRQLKAASLNITMSGPGDVNASGVTQDLNAEVSGSGDLAVSELRAARINTIMHGPGSVKLDGSSKELRAELSGSGDLNAKSLQAGRAVAHSRGPGNIYLNKVSDALEAELSGSGDLNATAECKSVKLTMNGPGDVKLDGKVDKLNAQLSGSGNLNARSLWANQADVVVRGPGNAVVNVKAEADQPRLVTYERSSMH